MAHRPEDAARSPPRKAIAFRGESECGGLPPTAKAAVQRQGEAADTRRPSQGTSYRIDRGLRRCVVRLPWRRFGLWTRPPLRRDERRKNSVNKYTTARCVPQLTQTSMSFGRIPTPPVMGGSRYAPNLLKRLWAAREARARGRARLSSPPTRQDRQHTTSRGDLKRTPLPALTREHTSTGSPFGRALP